MQDQQYTQVTQYIQQAYQSGASIEIVRANLLSSGWPEPVVMQLLSQQQLVAAPADPHRVRNAVFWIVGPFAFLMITALLQFVVRFTTRGGGSNGFTTIVNFISIIIGIVAVPMMVVGPIVGIVKLSKK